MSEALVRLLLLSLAGSLLALLLYLLQPLLKRLVTRRVLYVLWIIVMVRMVVPFGIASIGTGALLPPATLTSAATQPTTTHTPMQAPAPTQSSTTGTPAPTKPAATPTPAGSAIIGGGTTKGDCAIASLFSAASGAVDVIVLSVMDMVTPLSAALIGIWLLGALMSLLVGSVRHRRILREIHREARPASLEDIALLDTCREELRVRQHVEMIRTPSVPTPILSGIRRPLLCLPERVFTAEELRLVLQHELMHLKHQDMLVIRIANWVCAIHWFNPALYLIRHELSQAAELACDEMVSARLEKADRKRYGEVLLQQAAQRPYSLYSGTQALSESGRRLRQRLRVIAQLQGPPRRKRVAGLAVLLLLLVVPLPQFAPIALNAYSSSASAYIQDSTPTPLLEMTAEDALKIFIQNASMQINVLDAYNQSNVDVITKEFGEAAWSDVSYSSIDGGIPPLTKMIYLDRKTGNELSESEYLAKIEEYKKSLCESYGVDISLLDLQGEALRALSADEMTTRLEIFNQVVTTPPCTTTTRATCRFQFFRLAFHGKEASGPNGINNIRILFIEQGATWHFYSIAFDVAEKQEGAADA